MTQTIAHEEATPSAETATPSFGFVVMNPVAGEGDGDKVENALHAALDDGRYDRYDMTGDEDIREVVRDALSEKAYDWVAAVGGDGTVSLVADGLIDFDVPLVVVAAGTGNALAQALDIPQDLEAAFQLINDGARLRNLDALKIDDCVYLHQVGVGVESITMEKTSSDQKNRWGVLAYLWNALKEVIGLESYHFTLTLDGDVHELKAAELVVANVGIVGVLDLEWDESAEPDDGRIDVAVIHRSLFDYLRVVWSLARGQQKSSNHIQFFSVYDEIRLDAEKPMPIHGDGEILDDSLPLQINILPGAIKVFVPDTSKAR